MGILFLGTGSSVPSPERNVTCIAVKLESRAFLFDCGEGTQHQLQKCNALSAHAIERIFITHLHGDHILGLGGMIHAICCGVFSSNSSRTEPLHIYGPPGIRRYVHTILETTRPALDLPVYIHELVEDSPTSPKRTPQSLLGGRLIDEDIVMDPATKTWSVFQDEKVVVRAGSLEHKVPCWGYAVEETERKGNIDAELCLARGLQPGPLYRQLKEGRSVTLPDGSTLHPSEVVSSPSPGRKVVVLGDTCGSDGVAEIGQGTDLLIHECTLPRRLHREATRRGHSTAVMAGKFARKIKAKKLILTHFSARTTSPDEEDVDDMVRDAANVFGGPVVAAHDFMWENLPSMSREQRRKTDAEDKEKTE